MTDVRYSPEVEQALIGGALVDRRVVERLVADLRPSDFYTPSLSAVFGAMVDLHQSGFGVDPVTVVDHLRLTGNLERVDPAILVECMGQYGGSHLVPSYVAAVRRQATARMVGAACSEANAGLSEEIDPWVVTERLEARLASLSRAGEAPKRYWPSTGDFQAEDHSETLTPLADGVCYPLSRIMVVATEKLGKSVLLKQIAFCLAAGLHPFDPRGERIDPVRVLIFDAENDDDELVPSMARVRAGVEARCGPDVPWPALYSIPYGADLSSRRDLDDLYAVIEDCRPQLIVGGPVYKMTDQRVDLSEDRRAAVVIAVLNDIRKRWGSAVILEHHAPTGSGKARDIRAKGGQVWAAWVNMTIALRGTDDERSARVTYPHPPRGHFRWPKRFDRGMGHEWPWVPVIRTPANEDMPARLPQDGEDWKEEAF